jgi:hypothetical protein
MSKTTQPTIQQLEATNKVYKLRQDPSTGNDDKLSKLLNISKVTMYTRLKRSNWTNPEILFIEYLSNLKVKALVDSLNILKR